MALPSFRVTGSFLILLMSLSFWGCSTKAYIVKSMDPIMDDMNASVNRNIDVDMVRDAMPAFLVQMDGLIVSAPDSGLRVRASEAYFGYAFAFVEDTDRSRASLIYLKARDYALEILRNYRRFDRSFDGQLPEFKDALSDFRKKDVPAIYWAANNWLAWAALNLDKPETLMDIPKVEAMLKRSIELDETYYYGAAHASLGAFYAAQPRMIGGSPEKAKEHFDKAFALSRDRLLFIHLMYAKFYAYQIQDRDLFVKTLEKVIATPAGSFPDRAFANEVAKRKAKVLLEKVDENF